MDIQWYPGHMTKTKRQMQEDIRLIDLVMELTDARFPFSSHNPDIDAIAGGKPRLLLLNKADLADPAATESWERFFESKGFFTARINAQRGDGIKKLQPLIEQACAEKIERDRRRGIVNRPVRAMVCGIPNVGKSTFINSFAGKAMAKTGNRPGVTRGKQWIRLNRKVELLDTPGILWPKFDDPQVGLRLAATGSIRDEILSVSEIALWLIGFLKEQYPEALRERYQCETLEEIGRVRGCIRKEGEVDADRAAALVVDDFRKGKLGRITLEFPGQEG